MVLVYSGHNEYGHASTAAAAEGTHEGHHFGSEIG